MLKKKTNKSQAASTELSRTEKIKNLRKTQDNVEWTRQERNNAFMLGDEKSWGEPGRAENIWDNVRRADKSRTRAFPFHNFMPLFSHENSRGNIVSRAKRVRFEGGLVKIAFSQSNLTFCNRKVSHDRFMFNVHFVEQMSHEDEVFFAFCFYWFIFTT